MSYIPPRRLEKWIREAFFKRILSTKIFLDDNVIDMIIECLYRYNPSNQVYLVITETGDYSDYTKTIDAVGKDLSSGIQLWLNRISVNSTFTCPENPKDYDNDCYCQYATQKQCEACRLPDEFRTYTSVRNFGEEKELGRYVIQNGIVLYGNRERGEDHWTSVFKGKTVNLPEVENWLNMYIKARESYLASRQKETKIKEVPIFDDDMKITYPHNPLDDSCFPPDEIH